MHQRFHHVGQCVLTTTLTVVGLLNLASAVSPGALHEAVRLGDVDRVQRVLDAGVDVEVAGYATIRPLMMAAVRGHESVVDVLLKAGADVDGTTMGGRSALEEAARVNHAAIVQRLIDAGADLETHGGRAIAEATSACAADAVAVFIDAGINLDEFHRPYMPGGTPLMIAADRAGSILRHEQCLDIVIALLEAGADVNATDRDGHTAIMRTHDPVVIQALLDAGASILTEHEREHGELLEAAFRGDIETVRRLIDHGVPPDTNDVIGRNGLLYAIISGQADTAATFIDAGVAVDPTDQWNESFHHSPLMVAIRHGYMDVVDLLIEAGADVTGSMQGYTPAMVAALVGNAAALDRLLEAGATMEAHPEGPSPLSIAISRGDMHITKRLFDTGVTLTEDQVREFPAIIRATKSGSAALVQYFLERRGDVTARDGLMGMTALHHAARSGHADIVHLLLQHGAELDAGLTNNGWTPLAMALKASEIELAAALLDAGAQVDPSMLYEAVIFGNIKAAAFLIERGVDVNARDWEGNTALINAAFRTVGFGGSTPLLELLLDAGADVNAANHVGRTALMRAAEEGHAGMVAALLDAGADPKLTDEADQTALDVARERRESAEREAIIALLEERTS